MTTREPFRISHVVNAPIKKVWQAWTIQSQLEKWWGPVGLEMHVAKADVRPGGKFHYQMSSHPAASEKFEVWGGFDYLEVEEEQRIVFVNYFRCIFSKVLWCCWSYFRNYLGLGC